ncbi:toxic protein SymE [Izhakiella capsodis]|uniref:Toxic protein SymE n=1 Tax=Izhakiella capsodis TaxID=1367852 RepID=A0A1I4XAZ7_9GAMM|nr:SymE family type I addiction module toxin [Izhakiella capsodis]SFN22832.1 toxic protein SymE [Izhakiella capsodis]
MAEHDTKPEVAVTEAPQAVSHCEIYDVVEFGEVRLRGGWMAEAGFTDGMPVKIRVMPGCVVVTLQDMRELWGCIEGLSVTRFNRKKVSAWLKDFPGALNQDWQMPEITRR